VFEKNNLCLEILRHTTPNFVLQYTWQKLSLTLQTIHAMLEYKIILLCISKPGYYITSYYHPANFKTSAESVGHMTANSIFWCKFETKTHTMEKFAILARVEAKAGKEKEVLAFLKSALPLALEETDTTRWYALQLGTSTFGIFDTFETTEGRQAHLNGQIAAALMANAGELLTKEPTIEMVDLIAVK